MWQALSDGLSILTGKWSVVLGAAGVVSLGCGVIFFLLTRALEEKIDLRRSALILGGFLVVSIILRLAFVREAFVPPYFDSVAHYRITAQLLAALKTSAFLGTLPRLTPTYYHLGFHMLASLLAFGLRADPMAVILVLGQVLLAAIPVPVFFLIRQETQSGLAGFFGMLLAGFGWYMPGFAVNWGKYPALAGLLALELVLAIAYSLSERGFSEGPHRGRRREHIILAGWLILGTLLSMLFHTRALVIIAISIASWLIAGRTSAVQKTLQYLILGTLLAGLLVLGKFIVGEPLLSLTLETYLKDGIWVTLTIVALSPFALVQFRQGFYFCLLGILCLFAALLIPVGISWPILQNQTVLDRPFVEMVLYLPLSILGGLGLAGLIQTFSGISFLPDKTNSSGPTQFAKKIPKIRVALSRLSTSYSYVKILMPVLLVGFTALIAIGHYNFYPSSCCNFVGYDDTVAFDWLRQNLPDDAHILVAATPLNVLPGGPSANLAGTDAGIWIQALTGRKTSLASFDTDFRSRSTWNRLCRRRIEYIYIGGMDQSFNPAQLSKKTGWYDRILFLPEAQLYRLAGCSQ